METALNLNVDLKIEFTSGSNSPFIVTCQPVFVDSNGSQVNGLVFSSRAAAERYVHTLERTLKYSFLYYRKDLVFLS